MSASDAAPLPRLGEVYFDVRGESRTMRLSWYSGTGVAVFSIWQGGTCTGTFRLAIDDLPCMIEALQRGPRGVPDPAPAPQHSAAGRQGRDVPAPQAGDGGPGVTSVTDFATVRFPGAVGPADSAAAGFRPGYGDEPTAAYREAFLDREVPGRRGVPADREMPADMAPLYSWEPAPRGRHRGNRSPAYPEDRSPAYPEATPPGYADGPVHQPYGDVPGELSASGEYGILGEHRARHGRL